MDVQFQCFFFFQHLESALRQLEMVGDTIVDTLQEVRLTGDLFRTGLMGDEASAFQKDEFSLLQLHAVDGCINHVGVEIIQHQQHL